MPKAKHNIAVRAWLTPEQSMWLQKKAEKNDQTESGYIRSIINQLMDAENAQRKVQG